MRLRPLLLSAIVFSLAACGDDNSALAPMGYAPADTPYAIGGTEGLPRDVAEEWVALYEDVPGIYLGMLQPMIAELEAKPVEAAAALPALRALQTEIEGKTASQIIDTWGLSITARSALYGIDLVPVMRVELADVEKFRAGVERVASAAGESLPKARIDDLDYWTFHPDDAPLQLILALHSGQLVASIAPLSADDGLIRRLLGLELPADNLLDAGTLQSLSKRLDLLPQGSGYVDHARLFELFAQPATADQSAFLTALDITVKPMSEACLSEGRALTQQWPRTVLGYTRLDPQMQSLRMLIEAPKAVTEDLQTLLAPTPGLAASDAALASFSVALKVDALPPLANKWASAVAADPWKCEGLQELNKSFSQMRVGLTSPGVFMIGPAANSIHVLLSSLVLPKNFLTMPEVTGKLLIGSPNPLGLVSMAKNFVPQLSNVTIDVDAEPVALPTLPNAPPELKLFAAASEHALGIAFGEAERDSLRAAMSIDSGGAQPIMQSSYQGKLYADYMRTLAQQTKQANPNGPDMSAMSELYERFVGRTGMQVLFTDDGIELMTSNEMP